MQVPSDLLGSIYQAAAAPELWCEVVGKATEWVGGCAGSFQARKIDDCPETFLISTGIEDGHHATYLAHHHKHDPHLAHLKELGVGSVQLSCEILSDAELVRTEFYNDFWVPQNLRDLQGVVLLKNQHWAVSLAAFGHTNNQFGQESRQRLAALAPHFSRAVSLGFHFDGLSAAEPGLAAAAQMRVVDVLCVDASLRLVNSGLPHESDNRLRGDQRGLSVERGRLAARSAFDQERLESAVQSALRGRASSHVFGSGHKALSTAFAPGPRVSPIDAQRCVSVIFADVADVRSDQPSDGFADLPISLQGVAQCLARGMSDKEIAHELEQSLATTRTYVSRIMKRLDVRSRRELMQGPARSGKAL